jgi:hypothetical protein
MQCIRVVNGLTPSAQTPCARCQATGCPWDHVAGEPLCPDCQESLAAGKSEPLVARVDKRPCVICSHIGTLPFLTFPLHGTHPIELDLCGEHFRALLGRQLGIRSFQQLRRQLGKVGVEVRQVFLLHEAFYDSHGRALQPVPEPL